MTSRVHVGTPPDDFNGWTTTEVCYHGFANLPTTKDNENKVTSPEFSCFGHQWRLDIYPGGDNGSLDGYVAVNLVNRSNTSIKIQFSFSVRGTNGEELIHRKAYNESNTHEFACFGSDGNAQGYRDFTKRTRLIDSLINGSLVLEVRLRLVDTNKSITQFIPTNPIHKNVLKLFNEEETADVVFEVGGQQQTKGKRKRVETTTTNFHAHKLILKNNASTLYEMCKSDGKEGINTVSITDVKPEIFKHMLYNTYGGKLSKEDLEASVKDIINACDKYGVVHLKLEAEAVYVKSTTITIDNMMDNLLYADSKNLALLKEAVMDYIVKNKTSIIGKVSFDNVPSSMITDVLTATARGEKTNETNGEEDETAKYVRMRVGTLRKLLDEKGLDVDGSRESMIALLKENDD